MLKPLLHDDPQHIAGYRLVARLGSGGMGTVYLARSPGGRTVALKTVHARIAADTTFRTRFRLEVDAARVIGGVHGAQVFDADPLAEMPWLATEYILGPPLDEAVAGHGPLPETAVRAMGAALCGALGQLHRSDVVHRDLKPSNVMLSAYGPKIIDFGIARALGDARLTRTGTAAGTPAYMSPEQASGQDQTPAGDVFALAGVLVFAATGHGPFGGGQAADLLYRVRYADPDLTGVPPALAPVLARCLAKDPSLRPRTTDLLAELHDGHGEFADHLPAGLLSGDAHWHRLVVRQGHPECAGHRRLRGPCHTPSARQTFG
ncbi:serine/threonine-protein kinase [Streptomyces argenteolus]|uniref:serine/threonine-protein kinase n=1 Tax=Streptomyces sp. NPDC025273 TaxID=3155251 RepID=UPI0033E9478D